MQEMEWLGNIEACVIFTLQYAMLSSVLDLESLHEVFFRKNRFVWIWQVLAQIMDLPTFQGRDGSTSR